MEIAYGINRKRGGLSVDITKLWDTITNQPVLQEFLVAIALVLLGLALYLITKYFVLRFLYYVFCQTKGKWDQTLYEQGVFTPIPQLIPAIILFQSVEFLPSIGDTVQKFISVWIYLILVIFVDKFLTGVLFIYNTYAISKKRPIKGYVQIVKMLLYIVAGILSISILIDQSPWFFLSGIGALTAVLMLVFRDTILSFIASIQLMSNDSVRVGDWLEMPKYEADGDVVEVALHSIKIRNWDNTITTIPTYKMIEDSFKNWRGMTESGGRRIRRSLLIDQTSICFCSDEMLAKFEKIHLLEDYVKQKKAEIAADNLEHKVNMEIGVNGRRMTNLGTFRAYVYRYLQHHPKIHKDMTFLIRQLQPTSEGLPLEIYVFTTDVAWVSHENIQADIFDHLLAIISEFGLRVAQKPTGHDLMSLTRTFKD